MGYDNVLFNGKSMRNAIITKLSEDKHLTSALFANSNITILIDILSYMYQCLMSNLRQAASESMWSDTIFFENAARLARLIGYYAKGQMPFTILAKLISTDEENNNNNLIASDFGSVSLGYGPYDFNFAVVEHDVNGDQSMVKLALGDWHLLHDDSMKSDGTKFQEFIIKKHIDNYNPSEYISQKFVRVFTKEPNIEKPIEWTYTPDPLFLIQNKNYLALDSNPHGTRTQVASIDNSTSRYFNFYIDENGNYIIKFGDGLSTAIPQKGSDIYVFYVSSTETDKTITPAMTSALVNATSSDIEDYPNSSDIPDIYNFFPIVQGSKNTACVPVSTLSGYRDQDDAETIRQNSRAAFSRQNRLVTKEDYRTFLLENYPEWADIVVQNNWEYVSSFYGWLYAIEQDIKRRNNGETKTLLNTNKLQPFNSSDLADANNIYIWVLKKDVLDPNKIETDGSSVGLMKDIDDGIDKAKFENSLGAIKDITIHPVFLYALCKRFVPFAGTINEARTKINYNNPDPFENFESYFRIHVNSSFTQNLNNIKAKVIDYFKTYLFDNIKLGSTPNISALIKDIMGIDGVINITTVFNSKDEDIETEQEVNGMQFCTWTDTNNVLLSASDDASVGFNLPNIPSFQYFKAAQTYDEFIKNSLKFKIDYSVKS